MHHLLQILSLWMTLADLVESPAPLAGMQVFAADSDDLPDDEAQTSQAPAAITVRRQSTESEFAGPDHPAR